MLLPIYEVSPFTPVGRGDRFFCFSPKLCRYVSFSSKLERERWLLLEADPSVLWFCEQPCEIEIWWEGRWRRSRLDFWVRTKGGDEYYEEVKYAADLIDPKSRASRQVQIQRAALSLSHGKYRILTDRDICKNNILLNSVRTLMCGYDMHYPALINEVLACMPLVLGRIQSAPGISIDAALESRGDVSIEIYRLAIFDLIRSGEIDAEIGLRNLTPMSRLWAKKGGENATIVTR